LHISSFTTHQQNFGNFWMCGPEPQGLLWLEGPQDRATPFAVLLTHAPFAGRRSPGGRRRRERIVLVGPVLTGLDRVHRVGVGDRPAHEVECLLADQVVHAGDVDLQIVVGEVVPAERADGPAAGAPRLEVADLALDDSLGGREVVLAAGHDGHGVLEGLVEATQVGVGLVHGTEQLALVEVVARAVPACDGVLQDFVDSVGLSLGDLCGARGLGGAGVQRDDLVVEPPVEARLLLVAIADDTLRDEDAESESCGEREGTGGDTTSDEPGTTRAAGVGAVRHGHGCALRSQ
jgi:hypothetical protein